MELQQGSAKSSAAVGGGFGSIARMGLKYLGPAAVAGFIDWGVKLQADAEAAAAGYEVLLGSAGKANRMLKDIKEFANTTPFDLPELTNLGKVLLGFGIPADQVITKMRQIGDIAAASGQDINEIGAIFGKASGKMKVDTEIINQLQERSIDITGELAKKYGKSGDEILKMVERGKISGKDIQEAFESMTAAGGKYHGGIAKLANTVAGKWSTLVDTFGESARFIGEIFTKAFDFKGVMDSTTNFVSSLQGYMNILKPVIYSVADVVFETAGAIRSAFNSVMKSLGLSGEGFQEWRNWIMETIYTVGWSIKNWQDIWQLSVDRVALGMYSLWEDISHIFGTWIPSLWDNFGEITRTYFNGYIKNIAEVIVEIWDYITSLGEDPIEFDWTPMLSEKLTEKFNRDVTEQEKEMAKNIEAKETAMGESLASYLDENMASAKQRAWAVQEEEELDKTAKKQTDNASKSQAKSDTKAVTQGSKEAYEAIAKARKQNDPTTKAVQEVAKQQAAANSTLKEIAKNTARGGVSIVSI